MSIVGSESGMDARRVDADSSGAMDGVARLSVRPLRGVELQLSGERAWQRGPNCWRQKPGECEERHGDSLERCQYHRDQRKSQRGKMAPADEKQCM